MIILLFTSFEDISSHIHVATLVTLVWCFFAFIFAPNKMKAWKDVTASGISFSERVSTFFKTDVSISFILFIIFLILVFSYYIF